MFQYKSSFVSLSLLCSIFLTPSFAEADWPGWLGPNRDGWVADFTPPKQWPETVSYTHLTLPTKA